MCRTVVFTKQNRGKERAKILREEERQLKNIGRHRPGLTAKRNTTQIARGTDERVEEPKATELRKLALAQETAACARLGIQYAEFALYSSEKGIDSRPRKSRLERQGTPGFPKRDESSRRGFEGLRRNKARRRKGPVSGNSPRKDTLEKTASGGEK